MAKWILAHVIVTPCGGAFIACQFASQNQKWPIAAIKLAKQKQTALLQVIVLILIMPVIVMSVFISLTRDYHNWKKRWVHPALFGKNFADLVRNGHYDLSGMYSSYYRRINLWLTIKSKSRCDKSVHGFGY